MSVSAAQPVPGQNGLTCPPAQPCNFFGGRATPLHFVEAKPLFVAGEHKSVMSGGAPAATPMPRVGAIIDRAG